MVYSREDGTQADHTKVDEQPPEDPLIRCSGILWGGGYLAREETKSGGEEDSGDEGACPRAMGVEDFAYQCGEWVLPYHTSGGR